MDNPKLTEREKALLWVLLTDAIHSTLDTPLGDEIKWIRDKFQQEARPGENALKRACRDFSAAGL